MEAERDDNTKNLIHTTEDASHTCANQQILPSKYHRSLKPFF